MINYLPNSLQTKRPQNSHSPVEQGKIYRDQVKQSKCNQTLGFICETTFCPSCGVDVSIFSHENHCPLS